MILLVALFITVTTAVTLSSTTTAEIPPRPCGASYVIDVDSPDSSTGYIESPNYPQPYYPRANCTWDFVLPSGTTWQVESEDSSLVGFDFSVLVDGREDETPRVDIFDQMIIPPRKVKGHTNLLTAWFQSDGQTEARGFRIRVSGVKDCLDGADENCNERCGVPVTKPYYSSSDRIVGGIQAKPHSWPWQVSVMIGGWHMCGGSIIDHYFVLTAAHCCFAGPESTLVKIGDHSLFGHREPNSKAHRLKRIITHPGYNADPYYVMWDVCLLETEKPMFYNDDVQPVCLPSGMDIPDGERCYVTGWGDTIQSNYTWRSSTVDVKIVNQEKCDADYDGNITPDMICAQNTGNSCNMDSGGPLVCRSRDDQNRFEVHGVVSFARGCADPRYPGVYGRVTAAMDWIAQVMMDQKKARSQDQPVLL